MILGKMTKEEAIKVYRKTEEMKQRTRDYIVDGIVNWDIQDEMYFHFSHPIGRFDVNAYYSADISATYDDGKVEIDVYAIEDLDSEDTYNTFLADANAYYTTNLTDVDEAEKEVKAKLEKMYNEMLTDSYLEGIFLENYRDWYSDYDTEKGWI